MPLFECLLERSVTIRNKPLEVFFFLSISIWFRVALKINNSSNEIAMCVPSARTFNFFFCYYYNSNITVSALNEECRHIINEKLLS